MDVALQDVWTTDLPCLRTLVSLPLWLPTRTTFLLIAEPSGRGKRLKSVALAEAIAKEVASEVPEALVETVMNAVAEASEETVEATATGAAVLEVHMEIAEVAMADVEATATAMTVVLSSPKALPPPVSKHPRKNSLSLLSRIKRKSPRLLFLPSRLQ